ncbi:hypothetical protein BX666DRAFT_1881246 [Dichotomocladium elegans]|nr:hypothetical protein BX666DRAFT_1881246 [Dichotomocladium elegans]
MRCIYTTQDDMAAFNERLARYYAGDSVIASPTDSKEDGNVRRASTWSAGTTKALKRTPVANSAITIAKPEKESRGFLERSLTKLLKFKKEKHVDPGASASESDNTIGHRSRMTSSATTTYCLTESSPVWYSHFSSTPYHPAAGQFMSPSTSIATASA